MRHMHLLVVILAAAAASLCAAPEQRAIWAHFPDIKSPEAVQRTVDAMSAARLNAIYILVWYDGGLAAYRSALSPMMAGAPEGHDPLGALIAAAHARGIHVHAWFANGSYGWKQPGHVFTVHPEWQLDDGSSGPERWYDLGQPAVREFERDVMLDCLANYDVDGIHFDYIRYDSRGVCHCETCEQEVERRSGIPRATSDGSTFPLACEMSGNPLDKPTTAQVLATFDNRVPALTLNALGTGEAVLLNWHASDTPHAAVSAFARQMLERFGAAGAKVYQLRNTETTVRYGPGSQDSGVRWLEGLGSEPAAIDEAHLADVPPGATVVLHNQYLISPAAAAWLEEFVTAGGHALFVDGPVFAIKEPALQRVIGLAGTGEYFNEFRAVIPAEGQELIKPGPPVDLDVEKRRAAAWEQFRRDSVTDLVRQVYAGAKALKPEAQVSAAVFYDRRSADSVCQDWYGWLREGIIDYVLPMAYVDGLPPLEKAIDEWKAFDPTLERIIPGLSIYRQEGDQTVSRDAASVLAQQELCRSSGARGTCYFSLEFLSPEIQAALAGGPYAEIAEPYYPGGR
ncbi:MAG TPA: family 10 glycosylhydrolase [Armatimonadota bacterium]|mgnify:CR=1 FL=1|nr:family 10 glycosylhydrolase [Armatimonadota bacterium]